MIECFDRTDIPVSQDSDDDSDNDFAHVYGRDTDEYIYHPRKLRHFILDVVVLVKKKKTEEQKRNESEKEKKKQEWDRRKKEKERGMERKRKVEVGSRWWEEGTRVLHVM